MATPAEPPPPVNPLHRKLQWKSGFSSLLVGAPDDQQLLLLSPPPDVQLHTEPLPGTAYAWLLAYAHHQQELTTQIQLLLTHAHPTSVLWVAYPKQTGALKTDINRDNGWQAMTQAGWLGVTQVALDATWSALRFKPRDAIKVLTRKFDR